MKARIIKVLCGGLLLASVTSLSAFSLAHVFSADWWIGGTLVVPTNGNVQTTSNISLPWSAPSFSFKHVDPSQLGYGLFVTHQWYNSTTVLPSYRLEAQAWRFAPGYTLKGSYKFNAKPSEPSVDAPYDQSMNVSINDLSLSMLFDLFDYGSVTPYVGVGAAFLHTHLNGYAIASTNSSGRNPWDVSIGDGNASSVSLQYELGLDYHVSSRWAATLSYEYYPKVAIQSGDIYLKTYPKPTYSPGFKSDMSLGFLNMRLAYRF
jgi:opacity protein-like surface antigen